MASTCSGPIPEFINTSVMTACTLSQMSVASCSTHPACGKCCGNSRWALATSLNFLSNRIALLLVVFGRGSSFGSAMADFLITCASISVSLAVFNLIPVPPLDGSNILIPFLPEKARAFCFHYGAYFQIGLLVLLYLGWLSGPIRVAANWVFNSMLSLVFFLLRIVGL